MARTRRHRDSRGRFARRAARRGRRASYRRSTRGRGRRRVSVSRGRSGSANTGTILGLVALAGVAYLGYEELSKPAPRAAIPAPRPAAAPSVTTAALTAGQQMFRTFFPGQAAAASAAAPTPMVEAPVSAPPGQSYFAPGVSLQPQTQEAPAFVFQPLATGGVATMSGLGSLFGKRKVGALGKLVNIRTGMQATHKGRPVHVDAAGNLFTMSGMGLGSLSWEGRETYKRVLDGLGRLSFKKMVQGALRVGAAPLIIGKTLVKTGSFKAALKAGQHEILTPARQVMEQAQRPAAATPAGVPAGPAGTNYVGTDTNGVNVYQNSAGQWVNADGSAYTGIDAAYAPTQPAGPSNAAPAFTAAPAPFQDTTLPAPAAGTMYPTPSAGGGATLTPGLTFAGEDGVGNAYYFNQYGQTVDENGAPYTPQQARGSFAAGLQFLFTDAAGNAVYQNQYGQYTDEGGNLYQPVSSAGYAQPAPQPFQTGFYQPQLPSYPAGQPGNVYQGGAATGMAPYLVTSGVQAGYWYNPVNDTYFDPSQGAYYDGYGRPMDMNGNVVSSQSIWPQSQAQLDAIAAEDAQIDASFDATPSTAMSGLGAIDPAWGGWDESVFDRTNSYVEGDKPNDNDLLPALCGLGLLPVQIANAVDAAAGNVQSMTRPVLRTDIRAPRALFDGTVASIMAAKGLRGLSGLGKLGALAGGRFLRYGY